LNFDKINATLSRLPDQFRDRVAQVGVPKGPAYKDGPSVAYVAAIQEFGAPEMGIPARPFMRPTIAEHKADWVKNLADYIPLVIAGKWTGDEALDAVGAGAAVDMQATIGKLYEPALSPVTVLLRKWRKQGRDITGATVGEAARAIAAGVDPGTDDKPLVDSGVLVATIQAAVNNSGGDFSV
jgi:hypothetical protein